jgi:hypothetical protein
MPSCSENHEIAGRTEAGLLSHLQQKGLLVRAAYLGGVVIVAAIAILPAGWVLTGNRIGWFAGLAAGGVCLLAAWSVLGLSELLRKSQSLLALVLVGMMIRMGIPLAAALAVYFHGGPLADAGFLYYLVLFYFVTLVAETLLFLPERRLNEKPISPANDLVG